MKRKKELKILHAMLCMCLLFVVCLSGCQSNYANKNNDAESGATKDQYLPELQSEAPETSVSTEGLASPEVSLSPEVTEPSEALIPYDAEQSTFNDSEQLDYQNKDDESELIEEEAVSPDESITEDTDLGFASKGAPINGANSIRPASGEEISKSALAQIPFGLEDLYIMTETGGTLPMTSTLNDVTGILGNPNNLDELNGLQADAPEISLDYGYALVNVVLNERPQTIASITLRDATLSGPRGIKVGNSIEDVLASFPRTEPEEQKFEIQYIYRGNTEYPDLPSRGRILYDDTGTIPVYVMFDFPITAYTFDDPGEYIYQSHACLTYTVSDGIIMEISLSVGAYAE